MTLLGLSPYSLLARVLGAVLLAVALFAGGYYVAVRQYDRAAATAAQSAAQAATKAQEAKDAHDYQQTQADEQARRKAAGKATVVYQAIYRDRLKLVPSPKDCVVPAAAMHALNNPALIGDSQ